MAAQYEEAVQLLKDIEAHSGMRRLDRGAARVDHGDEEWTNRVYGEWLEPFKNEVAAIRLEMFGGAVLRRSLAATRILAPEACELLDSIPVGWASVPILNACAVRRNRATAIAMNLRLLSALHVANATNWDLQTAAVKGDSAAMSRAFARLRSALAHSSGSAFDRIMAETAPFPTRFHSEFGSGCSLVQILFILLHELGHVALGHLEQANLWAGHPLSDATAQFFASTADAEFEADAFAAMRLFDLNEWAKAGDSVELLGFALNHPDLIPLLIMELMIWFYIMAPMNLHDYYRIPRSHPHPVDRAQRIVDVLRTCDARFDCDKAQAALGRYRTYLNI